MTMVAMTIVFRRADDDPDGDDDHRTDHGQ